ncbi:MAG: hypothetical protein ACXWK0_08035 [Caulobacteraceae bacterium]
MDIGEVLGDTFAVIGRTAVVLANIAVMCLAIPAVIRIAGIVLTPVSPIFGILSLIGSLGTLVGMLFTYATIFQVAMNDLHDQPTTTEAMFKIAARKFWPMAGLAILFGLGVFAGMVLLIVPGVILALAWSVAMPALVLEDRGVFDSFKRSAALTRGKRWSIFLLSFMIGIVIVIAELILFALFGGFNGVLSGQASTASVVLSSLLSVITSPFGAVVSTALLNQLRDKDGYGAEAVAEVFA